MTENSTESTEPKIDTCPACGVKIQLDPRGLKGCDKVLFSAGKPGTRARLSARVCGYTKKSGCINKDKEVIGEIPDIDYYRPLI